MSQKYKVATVEQVAIAVGEVWGRDNITREVIEIIKDGNPDRTHIGIAEVQLRFGTIVTDAITKVEAGKAVE